MKLKVLLVITGSFPYDYCKEDNFINPEIDYYSKYYDRVIFCPNFNKGSKSNLLDGIEVTDSLAQIFRKNTTINHLFSKDIRFLFIQIFSNFFKFRFFKIDYIKYVFSYFIKSKNTQSWLKKYLSFLSEYEVTIYTYWCDYNTLGACFLKNNNNLNFKIVSRAHGADLYEERNSFGIIPFRHFVLQNISGFIPISNSGLQYINSKYPDTKKAKFYSRLGVKGLNRVNYLHDSGILRVVSCSSVIKLKRVDLIFRALNYFSNTNDLKIIWHHFGNGSEFNNLNEIIRLENLNREKLQVNLHGNVDIEYILNFYDTTKVDLFMNLSTHEGIPVSIMEAQSFGIPVIACNVGGISEIVFNGLNGYLLNETPSILEISAAINSFVNETSHDYFKQSSYKNWLFNYNANKNYHFFLDYISNLK